MFFLCKRFKYIWINIKCWIRSKQFVSIYDFFRQISKMFKYIFHFCSHQKIYISMKFPLFFIPSDNLSIANPTLVIASQPSQTYKSHILYTTSNGNTQENKVKNHLFANWCADKLCWSYTFLALNFFPFLQKCAPQEEYISLHTMQI